MRVEKLTLKNFRNVEESTLYPDSSINFLVGANGQGKTSFLEALGFLSTLRSFRDAKIHHLIRWNCLKGEISCELRTNEISLGDWRTQLKIDFEASNEEREKTSKTAYINGKSHKSSTQYLSQRFGSYHLGFHSIIFNPSDHDLIRGEPSIRRSYLDRVIAAEDVEYLKALQKYNRILHQRNALLKSIEPPSSEMLHGFTEPLCHYGASLTRKRLQWIFRLTEPLQQSLNWITPLKSPLRFVYLSSWLPMIENLSYNNKELSFVHFTGQGQVPSLELLEQMFWARVLTLETAERKAKHSLVGPHRDDWTFFLGGQILKGHGSQGEVRSALLALKLSEIELFRSETGHRPLFLLDDFSSELDRERRLFLLQFLKKTDLQCFVTTTEDSSDMGKRYWVLNGMIKEGIHDDRAKAV